MMQNRHQGERFFIGGFSPNINRLNRSHLSTGRVIGVNQFPEYHPGLDYWIAYDSESLCKYDSALLKIAQAVTCERFMKQSIATKHHRKLAEHWYNETSAMVRVIPQNWTGELCHVATTAVDAVHLAYIMGASEIILWGVDLCGDERADGKKYPAGDIWPVHVNLVNQFLNNIPVPVYKTNLDSPLNLPFKDFYPG